MIKKTILFILTILLSANVFAGKEKIVFSKTTISEETGKSLADATFQLGDDIYLRYYLKKELKEYLNGKYILIVFKLGEKTILTEEVNTQPSGWDNVDFSGKQSHELFLNKTLSLDNIKVLNNLANSTHDITVEILCKDKLIVSGAFKLSKTEGNKMTKAKLGVNFSSLVTAKMTDPALEDKVIKTLATRTYLKVNKIKIISEDWLIHTKPSTGAILGRFITVAILAKGDNDNCVIKVYNLEQQYNGSGYQDNFGGLVEVFINKNNGYHSLHDKIVDCE